MNWDDYRDGYSDFSTNVFQATALALIAGEVLADFPRLLPEHLRDRIDQEFEAYFASQLSSSDEGADDGRVTMTLPDDVNVSVAPTLLAIYIPRLIREALAGRAADPDIRLNFEPLVQSQELVTVFAMLDAFLADSLRAACRVCPAVMKSGKQTTWAEVVEAGGWDQLMNQLAERFVYEFGWHPIQGRVKFLNDRLGLKLRIDPEITGFITKGEQIRHVVVHNGGKISQAYIDNTGQSDLAVGEPVPLSYELIAEIAAAVQELGVEVFTAISVRFFGQTESDLDAIVVTGHLEKRRRTESR